MRRFFGALALVGLLAGSPALAHHDGDTFFAGDMIVGHAWAHENAAMAHANAVYLTLTNDGDEADRLIGIEGDFFASAEIQAPVLGEDGVLRTVTVPAVEIAPGQSLTFQPGGIQIVLVGLQQTFFDGDHFHLTLVFDKGGRIEIEVDVEDLDHTHDHDHDHSS